MSKYINVDNLKEEIKKFSATEYGDNTFGDDVANGALDYVLEKIIPSLQQEQPEVDLEEVFEKEYAKFSNDTDAGDYALPIDISDYKYFARHFYELGLNARKLF